MKVVRGSSRRKQGNVLGFGNSGDVTAEYVRVLDEVGTVLGAKDAMHQVGGVSVRHAERVMKDRSCHGDRWHIGMFGVPSLRRSPQAESPPNVKRTDSYSSFVLQRSLTASKYPIRLPILVISRG